MKKKTLSKLQKNLSRDYMMSEIIKHTPMDKPFVDDSACRVHWGTSKDTGKNKKE